MKALIIDPSKSYGQLLVSLFEEASFETVILASGEEGLSQVGKMNFDLICISLHLRDMSGIDFCKTLRQQKSVSIPVIMITSDEKKEVSESGMSSGITELFKKSDLQAISKYLSNFVDLAESDRQLAGKILYIEDSISVATITRYRLRLMGLEVNHFTNAEAAYEELIQNPDYDLVLTDILLEGHVSGLRLIRDIRRKEKQKQHIPILAISGLEDTARKIEILRSGANDFIQKPVLLEELSARVKNLITNKKLLDQVKAQQKRLEEMALTDQLTSLYNRHCLADLTPKLIHEALRHGFPLSMVMIDLDHFKAINDQYGHDIGDVVLVEVAKLIKASSQNESIAARFGGEEFLLVLPHCNEKQAGGIAEHLRGEIESLEPNGIRVTASLGVAQLPRSGSTRFEDLFCLADKAVYEAKEKGRNQVILHEGVL